LSAISGVTRHPAAAKGRLIGLCDSGYGDRQHPGMRLQMKPRTGGNPDRGANEFLHVVSIVRWFDSFTTAVNANAPAFTVFRTAVRVSADA